MKKSKFNNGGEAVQVGFLDVDNAVYLAADTASSAFAADSVIQVKAESADVWIAINTNPTASAQTNGNTLIYVGLPENIAIEKGDKIIATGEICVTPYK